MCRGNNQRKYVNFILMRDISQTVRLMKDFRLREKTEGCCWYDYIILNYIKGRRDKCASPGKLCNTSEKETSRRDSTEEGQRKKGET